MREHEVPTHVQAEDKVLLWFTFPQIVAVVAVCAVAYGAYRYFPFGPMEFRLGLAIILGIAGIALTVGKVGGRGLPLVAADLLKFNLGARSLAGKPLAKFRATRDRRIPVLYGIVSDGIRHGNRHTIEIRRPKIDDLENVGFPARFLGATPAPPPNWPAARRRPRRRPGPTPCGCWPRKRPGESAGWPGPPGKRAALPSGPIAGSASGGPRGRRAPTAGSPRKMTPGVVSPGAVSCRWPPDCWPWHW